MDTDRSGAPARDSGLSSLGKQVVGKWFARRHESPMARRWAGNVIRDAQLWRRIYGR